MALTVYNTLSKSKELFKPLQEGKVSMYVCGPTVYDYLHIGNFRGAIFFNLVRNWLEHLGHEVTYVYNYTDVDDKIIKRAQEENVDSSHISETYIKVFEEDYKRLGLRSHSKNPRVTEHIDDIIQLVQNLVDQDKAYVIDGEVFYSIDKFDDYGKLSGKVLEDLEAGQRVDVDERKQNPFDFVLWKPSKDKEPSWDSPWGKGRPGWHIECSAMIKALLGDSIDIHGGGIDLIFPHHENEIAQGEGCSGKKYCNYWMHNNFISFNDEKMSKSLGNVVTARSFMDTYHPEILKYAMLSGHYRSMMSINSERIEQTIAALSRIYRALKTAQDFISNHQLGGGSPIKALAQQMETADARITKALNDDFNTGEMLSHIFEVVRTFNAQNIEKKSKDPNAHASALAFISWMNKWSRITSLFADHPEAMLERLNDILVSERQIDRKLVEKLIAKRNQAREQKDWTSADAARDELLDLGIEMQDKQDGTTAWSVKI